MDFLQVILFLLWFEMWSLPLRFASAGWSAPPDVRRMLSRLAGPPLLALPVWFAAHAGAGFLTRPAGLAWLALAPAAALLAALRQTRSISRLFAYEMRNEPGTADGLVRSPNQSQISNLKSQINSQPCPSIPHSAFRIPHFLLDALWLALVLSFAAFRRWVPEMTTYQLDTSAAEKFANAMFFWSSWHARTLPPQDYWLAGTPLTYYYWGHFHWAWLGRLGGFSPAIALNLAFAVAASLVWVAAYLLARAARLPRGWSAVAALCAAWAGNPEAIRQVTPLLQAHGFFHPPISGSFGAWSLSVPAWIVAFFKLLFTVPMAQWGFYDYWAPSRAIPNVVDEFPAFSAILGDFHAHHLALPWLIGWVALAVAGGRWTRERGRPRPLLPLWDEYFNDLTWGAAWIALGAAAVLTNLWNLPLIGLGLLILVTSNLVLVFRNRNCNRIKILLLYFISSLILILTIFIGMRLLRAGAPLPLPAAAAPRTLLDRLPFKFLDPNLRTPLANLFGLWGFPILILTLSLGVRWLDTAFNRRGSTRRLRSFAWFSLIGLAPIVPHFSAFGALLPGGIAWFWIGLAAFSAALMSGPRPWLARAPGLMLLAACAVLAGLELIYLPDRFVGDLARYNSYFKFSYPVWPLLWVGAFAAARPTWRARLPRALRWGLVRPAFFLILLAGGVYTLFAMPARVNASRSGDAFPRLPTLDAFAFVAQRELSAPEAPLLDWIRRNVPPGDTVAEGAWAVPAPDTPAYKYQGRIASLAGHPIPIGWAHHEQQWRGETGYAPIDARINAVNALYNAPTADELRARAAGLGVRWVVYGVYEAALYGPAALARLRAALPLAASFPSGAPQVFLFQINSPQSKMKTP